MGKYDGEIGIGLLTFHERPTKKYRMEADSCSCPIFADFSDRIAHYIDKEDFALYHDLNKVFDKIWYQTFISKYSQTWN